MIVKRASPPFILCEDSEAQARAEGLSELRGEVRLLRLERQRLVEISNDLRGELREPEKRLAPQERRKLLEAEGLQGAWKERLLGGSKSAGGGEPAVAARGPGLWHREQLLITMC